MTNKQIIFNQSLALMKEGVIGSTGRVLEFEDEAGGKITYQEPEPIHTYAAWKSIGYQVRRGEKAIATFTIWKNTVRKAKNPDEEDTNHMFMKTAHFFKLSQVDPIAAT